MFLKTLVPVSNWQSIMQSQNLKVSLVQNSRQSLLEM